MFRVLYTSGFHKKNGKAPNFKNKAASSGEIAIIQFCQFMADDVK